MRCGVCVIIDGGEKEKGRSKKGVIKKGVRRKAGKRGGVLLFHRRFITAYIKTDLFPVGYMIF